MSLAAVEIGSFGNHVREGSGFRDRQLAAFDGRFERFANLGFRPARQRNLCPLDCFRHLGLRCGRVIADRSTHAGIPEVRIIETGGPGAGDHADEAICSLHRPLKAGCCKDKDFRILGDCVWRGTSRQRDLRTRGVSGIAQAGPCLDRLSLRFAHYPVNSRNTKQKQDHSRKLSFLSPASCPILPPHPPPAGATAPTPRPRTSRIS